MFGNDVRTAECVQAARERHVSDPRDQGHEHGSAVRRIHGCLLVHNRVPPATRPRVLRTRGRGAPAVRLHGSGRPRGGRMVLDAVRAVGHRLIAGCAPVHRP